MTLDLYPVVVLAGGLATRLRPVTSTLPKSLVSIKGEPFIDHQLRLLAKRGVRKVLLCVGYLGEMIQDHVKDGRQFGLNVIYSFDGPELLGTAGAIKRSLPQLEEYFFVTYGDSYLDLDYASVQAAFQSSQKPALMTVFHNQGQWDTSNVEFSNGNLIAYDKKNLTKQMHYIDYGLGVFKKNAFDQVPSNKVFDLAALYQQLLTHNQLAGHEVDRRFYEIGSFAGIKELEYYLSQ